MSNPQEKTKLPFDQKAIRFLEAWRRLFRVLEGNLVDVIAMTVPWLAPFIPAYMGYNAMETVLKFPWEIALVGAAVIEALGLSTVHTVFTLWDYNDTKNKSDDSAKTPMIIAIVASIFYLLIVLLVNVLLDEKASDVQKIAKALLSCFSIISSVTLSIRANHARRLEKVEQEKIERKQRRLGLPVSLPSLPAAQVPQLPMQDMQIAQEPAQEAQVAVLAHIAQSAVERARSRTRFDWRTLPNDERDLVRNQPPEVIRQLFPNIPERTAQQWSEYGRAMAPVTPVGTNGTQH